MWTFAGKDVADILATTKVITSYVSHRCNREVGGWLMEKARGGGVYTPNEVGAGLLLAK